MIQVDNRLGALEPEYKKTFAKYLFDGLEAFTAALRMWPNDASFAYYISEKWSLDPFVREQLKDLRTAKKREVDVPSKTELAREIYDDVKLWRNADDKVKGYRLIAEMLGHLEKAAPNTSVTNNSTMINNRVMIIKDHGADAEWSDKLRAQQARLVSDA